MTAGIAVCILLVLAIPIAAIVGCRSYVLACCLSCAVGVPIFGWWQVHIQSVEHGDFDVFFHISWLVSLALLCAYYVFFTCLAKLARWMWRPSRSS